MDEREIMRNGAARYTHFNTITPVLMDSCVARILIKRTAFIRVRYSVLPWSTRKIEVTYLTRPSEDVNFAIIRNPGPTSVEKRRRIVD